MIELLTVKRKRKQSKRKWALSAEAKSIMYHVDIMTNGVQQTIKVITIMSVCLRIFFFKSRCDFTAFTGFTFNAAVDEQTPVLLLCPIDSSRKFDPADDEIASSLIGLTQEGSSGFISSCIKRKKKKK